MRICVVLLALIVSSPIFALDMTPYPQTEISEQDWGDYHKEVVDKIGSSRRAYDEHYLEVFSEDETRANIAFTMPGHKAHPAWVTRYVHFEEGALNLVVVGYYAGDKTAFEKLFAQYEAMAERTRKQFRQD